MKLPYSHRLKQFSICTLLGLFLFVNVVGIFGVAQTASAQISVPITDANTGVLVGLGLKEAAKETVKETKLSLKNALLQSFLSALVQGASYFTRKLAYDSAKWVASGGKGQSALAFQDGFGKYIERTAADAGATAVEEFGSGFGLSLCSLPNINLQLYLQLSIPQLYPGDSYGPSTSCTFSQLQNNWNDEGRRNWREQTSNQLAENFSRSLQVDTNSSDFGIALGAIGNVDRIRAAAQEANIFDRLEGGGFKSVTDFISGNILTPGDLIRYEAKSVTQKDQGQAQADQIAGIYGVQALNIIPQAGSIFLNTLVSEGLKNLLAKKGLIPQKTPGEVDEDSGPGRATARDIEDAVSFFLKATTPRTGEDIDIVATMAACPSDSPGLNNCVMDNGLYTTLIRESRNQQRLTIAEAIQEGLLNRDWSLIPPTNGLNDDYNCYDGRYCYSNIQKMRKLRILPLGFEVAALRSDPDQPWTLGQVVENFENCGPRNPDGSVNPDPGAYPFCHLIDPNWVLREPVSRCEAEVFGPELAGDNTNIRREECVDVSTCVSFDENGKCEQYGYCTREQNVWEIPGEQCDEQFATCETFIDTQTKKASSFLTRTLDADECTSDSVGCRAYSTEKVNGEWVSVSATAGNGMNEVEEFKKYGRNRTLFFDKDVLAKTCPNNQAGCSAFFLLDKTNVTAPFTYDFVRQNSQKVTVNIKKAPEYLNCYDTKPNEAGVQWPADLSELPLLSNSAECAQYAPVCLPEEVGCDGYTPVDGNDTVQVPGIIGQNACSAQCVGYGAYRQLASRFEPAKDPLYFIPKDADACSLEHVGCSEFTNLDELARGGESRAYFTDTAYCEKPADAARSNEKVFYTWEGSASSGYVIKTHRLKRVSDTDRTILVELLDGAVESSFADVDAPAVPQLSQTEVNAHYLRCNEEGYRDLINGGANPSDADCREFIDEAGQRFYRLMSEVVRVSDQCSPYRISQPVLESDGLTQQACGYAKGLWNAGTNSCERCMGGGEYRDGACIYNILASESNSCPASANQCRSYTGNFAANVRTVSFFDFEPEGNSTAALATARGSWTSVPVVSGGVQVVSEAVQVGGSSLQINTNAAEFELSPGQVSTDAGRNIVHTLSFWARGLSQTVQIGFYQDGVQVGSFTGSAPASIGDNWRRYEFGPIAFTGNEGVSTTVRFTRSGSGAYFVDNLRLSRVEDTYAFVKDSWKTAEGYSAPLACDSNPVDAFPGEQLGCTAYTQESDNATVYATGFQNLCREEAIGCRALVDTYNTESETAMVYNASCDHTRRVPFGGNPEECTQWKDAIGVSCMVQPGQSSCVINEVEIPSGSFTVLGITKSYYEWAVFWLGASSLEEGRGVSSVIYPPDTSVNTPMFLSTHSKYSCDGGKYLGCENVGLETEALPGSDKSTFVTTTLINSPYIYKDILCTKAEIGCTEYSTDTGLSYFKDPALVGSLMCQYSEGDGIRQKAGWYLEGIGRCATASMSEEDVGVSSTLSYCRVDSDCAGVQVGGSDTKCRAVNKTACYPEYLVGAGEYGLYSNADVDYDGFVGMCPAEQNGCTEFIDRADTNPAFGGNGRSYYTILDETALEAAGECGGKASLREGCVLFDQTNNPSRLYDTAATYALSEQTAVDLGQYSGAQRPSLVSPITTGNLNSNTILKVGRNRECSEWLACRSSIPYTNSEGRQEYLCYDYDVCNEADGENCGNFVSNTSTGFGGQYLSQENYVSRDTSWYGRDYSGYSLFQKYPVADFQSVVFSSMALPSDEQYAQQMKNPFLFYQVPDELLQGVNAVRSCTEGGNPKADWTLCGGNNGGRCFSGSCLYPISGSFPAPTDFNSSTASTEYKQFVTYATPNSCKAFPEEDSPFPQTVLIENNSANRLVPPIAIEDQMQRWIFGAKQNKYVTSAVCQDGDCVCDYNKVVYEDGTQDYFSASNQNITEVQGYCASGPLAGTLCNPNTEEVQCGGTESSPQYCVSVERIERRLGTLGFCLEYDLSRPVNGTQANGVNAPKYACLTWLPLEISASRIDTYNQDILAGYEPSVDAVNADGGVYGQVYCTDQNFTRQSLDVERLNNTLLFSSAPEINRTGIYLVTSTRQIDSGDPYRAVYGLFKDDGFYNTSGASYISGAPNVIRNQMWREYTTLFRSGSGFDWDSLQSDSLSPDLQGTFALSVMDLWAKRFFTDIINTPNSPNSSNSVLRLEVMPEIARDDASGTDKRVGFFEEEDNAYFKYGLNAVGDSYDGVTFLHPPRHWDLENRGAEGSFGLYVTKLSSYNFPAGSRFRSDSLSPETEQAFDSSGVVNSNKEKIIRDYALKRVAFVSYMYPDFIASTCAGGDDEGSCNQYKGHSALLSQEVSIPFALFNGSEDIRTDGPWSVARASRVPSWYDSREYGYMSAYSYVLRKSDISTGSGCLGLISHCDYVSDGRVNVDISTEAINNPRNSIDKRYVVVVYHDRTISASGIVNPPEFFAEVVNQGRTPRNTSEDPFSAACVQSTPNSRYTVIGMDFNEDGEFLGYITRNCDDVGGMLTAVVASEYEMCTEYHPVHDSLATTIRNKAVTNAVWSGAENNFPRTPNTSVPDGYSITKNTLNSPFGSLPITTSQVRSGAYGDMFRLGTFANEQNGKRLANIAYLNNLFVYTFSGIQVDEFGFTRTIAAVDKSNVALPQYAPNSDKPSVYSLNPFICNDEQGEKTCTAGERGYITVNGKNANLRDYDGDGVADEDQAGVANVADGTDLISVDSYQAQVRFFGMADRDHMPIRRVMVRWDESGTGITPSGLGFQKNRKPYCLGSDGATNGSVGYCVDSADGGTSVALGEMTCSSDDECQVISSNAQCLENGTIKSFGNSSRACQEGYFEFQHTYSCDAGDIGENGMLVSQIQNINPDMYRRLQSGYGLENSDVVCVYKPGVQVLDNWGWCNASTISTLSGVGAGSSIVVGAVPNSAGSYSGNLEGGNCAPSNDAAWSYFNGIVIVVPEDALPGNR